VATSHVVNASKLRQQQRLSEQLQDALKSRVVIEQAKGITAANQSVTVDVAYQLIRACPQEQRQPAGRRRGDRCRWASGLSSGTARPDLFLSSSVSRGLTGLVRIAARSAERIAANAAG
jgi:hypothetical protein